MKPPDVGETWDRTSVWGQAQLIAYSQIRSYEDDKFQIDVAGSRLPR